MRSWTRWRLSFCLEGLYVGIYNQDLRKALGHVIQDGVEGVYRKS